jgi:hypothetical protein
MNPISIINYSSTYYLFITSLIRISFLIFYFIIFCIQCITKMGCTFIYLFIYLLFAQINAIS